MSATKIHLASTVVQDGPASTLLAGSVTAMDAVVAKVNAAGGICGRLLELTKRNDSFSSATGQQYIQNFIEGDYFALAVVPSAEGLGAAILAGDIRRAGIPVVGTDGLREEQYHDPWVWPVATATVSTMRTIASYSIRQKKAKTIALVWDQKYQFGIEGRNAFVKQAKAMGAVIKADIKLDPLQASYASEVDSFNNKCKDGACDAVVMLLLPDTAQKWMSRKPEQARLYTAGAQTLFTNDFAKSCASSAELLCDGLAVWTGYNPPIDRYAALPDVARYVSDVRAKAPSADIHNQFMEGAYLGMSLLVDALRKVGPELTRIRLKQVLDSMEHKNQITAGLSWRPGQHFANTRARSFSMVVSDDGRFSGWRDERTGWVRDPAFGG